MRLITLTGLLFALFLAPAWPQSSAAQRPASAAGQESSAHLGEALRALERSLSNTGQVTAEVTNVIMRLSSPRAEGCVLRYNIVSEREWSRPNYTTRPQVSDDSYSRTVYEWRVDLAGLDPALVGAENRLRLRRGEELAFYASAGARIISLSWQESSARLGTRRRTDRVARGFFPVRNEDSVEGIRAALRRAIEACRRPFN